MTDTSVTPRLPDGYRIEPMDDGDIRLWYPVAGTYVTFRNPTRPSNSSPAELRAHAFLSAFLPQPEAKRVTLQVPPGFVPEGFNLPQATPADKPETLVSWLVNKPWTQAHGLRTPVSIAMLYDLAHEIDRLRELDRRLP